MRGDREPTQTVLLGVSGSIAAYRGLDVASQLVQRGLTVRVTMTEAARRFVTPLAFESITQQPVFWDLWAEQPGMPISHIHLANTADLLAIVPASADILAKLAQGMADDALTATALACKAPLLLAPAMNRDMWTHPATIANTAILRARGARFIGPVEGRLAEGIVGIGRLAPVEAIVDAIAATLTRRRDLAGQHIVVTAGPTIEAIDPVRFISNRSSGKMGYALAEAAHDRGATVTLISGPVALPAPPGLKIVRVVSAEELLTAVQAAILPNGTLIMAAAVADYRPARPFDQKLKRGDVEMHLILTPNPDILLELRRPPELRVVAFAAETRDLLDHASAKLLRKRADLLVANDVSESGAGFDTDTNHVWILRPDQPPEEVPPASKRAVAETILDATFAEITRRES